MSASRRKPLDSKMNAKLFSAPFHRSLALGCMLFALFAARSQAVTISASVFNQTPFTLDDEVRSELNPTLGTFNFATDPNWSVGAIQDLGNVNITLRFSNLNTNTSGSDYNQISLTLGGYNTGILLNGYHDGSVTLSFNQAPTNAASIIEYLNTHNGLLTFGIYDSGTGVDPNYFGFSTAVTSLSFVGATVGPPTPVPFTPVQTLGYGLIALAVAWRRFRWANPFALVMARVAVAR